MWLKARTREPRCRILSFAGQTHLRRSRHVSAMRELPDREPARASGGYYPLHALVCEECFLVQLQENASPDHIFSEYAYFSSYSTSRVEHARSYCHMVKDRLRLGPHSLAVGAGQQRRLPAPALFPLGVPVLGIEPTAKMAEAARRHDVPTLVEFFGTMLAERLVAKANAPILIIGNNVLAQVPDLNDFVAA
jgi:hypothetical protein